MNIEDAKSALTSLAISRRKIQDKQRYWGEQLFPTVKAIFEEIAKLEVGWNVHAYHNGFSENCLEIYYTMIPFYKKQDGSRGVLRGASVTIIPMLNGTIKSLIYFPHLEDTDRPKAEEINTYNPMDLTPEMLISDFVSAIKKLEEWENMGMPGV